MFELDDRLAVLRLADLVEVTVHNLEVDYDHYERQIMATVVAARDKIHAAGIRDVDTILSTCVGDLVECFFEVIDQRVFLLAAGCNDLEAMGLNSQRIRYEVSTLRRRIANFVASANATHIRFGLIDGAFFKTAQGGLFNRVQMLDAVGRGIRQKVVDLRRELDNRLNYNIKAASRFVNVIAYLTSLFILVLGLTVMPLKGFLSPRGFTVLFSSLLILYASWLYFIFRERLPLLRHWMKGRP